MRYRTSLLSSLAVSLMGISGISGCNERTTDPATTVDTELESVERVEPEADVEVMPSGEVDVQVEPEVE